MSTYDPTHPQIAAHQQMQDQQFLNQQNTLGNIAAAQQIANQQNSLAGIGAALGAAPYWVNQPQSQQQMQLPLHPKEAWSVEIEKTENGFLVDVFCRKEGRTLRYVATTVEEVMQNVATGMVTAKMEA